MSTEPRPFVDHYATLGIPPTASGPEIHAAYRVAKRSAAPEERGRVEKAFEVLSNPNKRGRYDRVRGERLAASLGEQAASPSPARATHTAARMRPTPRSPVRSVRERSVPRARQQPAATGARTMLREAFRGPVGLTHALLVALALAFAVLQPLTWATVTDAHGATSSYSAWGGTHAGLYLTVTAFGATAAEIALRDHRRWWWARVAMVLFLVAIFTIAATMATNEPNAAVSAAQYLGIPFQRATVTVTGVPGVQEVVALGMALTLAARTAIQWRSARAARPARVTPRR